MLRLAMVLVAALAFSAQAATAATPIAFGRKGGNIVPLTVRIAADGTITTAGPATGVRPRLGAAAVAGLVKLAAAERFSVMPATTLCPRTLPDIAAAWISVGSRRVSVHGGCRPAFSQLYAVLSAAVGLPD